MTDQFALNSQICNSTNKLTANNFFYRIEIIDHITKKFAYDFERQQFATSNSDVRTEQDLQECLCMAFRSFFAFLHPSICKLRRHDRNRLSETCPVNSSCSRLCILFFYSCFTTADITLFPLLFMNTMQIRLHSHLTHNISK